MSKDSFSTRHRLEGMELTLLGRASVPTSPSFSEQPRRSRLAGALALPRCGLGLRYGLLRQGYCADGVFAVAIRADLIGILLRNGRAANQDLDLAAHARLFEGVNGGLHQI